MKKNYCLLIFLFSFFISHFSTAQPSIQWQQCFGGPDGGNYPISIVQTNDSGYAIAGYSDANGGDVTGNHGGNDFWVVKTDKDGNLQWEKSLGGSQYEQAYSIQQTRDGGYVIAGETNSNDGDVTGLHGDDNDYWITKLDSSGNLQWEKTLGGSGDDGGLETGPVAEQTADGGFIVGGYSNSTDGDVTGNHGGYDYWIVKLDTVGNIQWEKSYGGSMDDELRDIHQTFDKGYIIAGVTNSDDGDVNPGNGGLGGSWIVKVDSIGTIQWQTLFDCIDTPNINCNGSQAASVIQTKEGGYIVGGTISQYLEEFYFDATKIDSAGKILGHEVYGNSSGSSSIKRTNDDGYIMAGHADCGECTYGFYVVKKGNSGFWFFNRGGNIDAYATSAIQTSDGGFIIVGYDDGGQEDPTCNNYFGPNYKVIKLGPPSPCSANFTLMADTTQLHHYIATNHAFGTPPLFYDWSWGDGTHDYTPFPSHTYADSGYYDICLTITDSLGCISTYCDSSFHVMRTTNYMVYINVVPSVVTGIGTFIKERSDIHIYPNPAANQITLEVSSLNKNNPAYISITNVVGQVLRESEITNPQSVIDISPLSPGIYFVQVVGEKERWVGKFVKE